MQFRELLNCLSCYTPNLGISFRKNTHRFRCYHNTICLYRHLRHNRLDELLHFLDIGNYLVFHLVLRLRLFQKDKLLLFNGLEDGYFFDVLFQIIFLVHCVHDCLIGDIVGAGLLECLEQDLIMRKCRLVIKANDILSLNAAKRRCRHIRTAGDDSDPLMVSTLQDKDFLVRFRVPRYIQLQGPVIEPVCEVPCRLRLSEPLHAVDLHRHDSSDVAGDDFLVAEHNFRIRELVDDLIHELDTGRKSDSIESVEPVKQLFPIRFDRISIYRLHNTQRLRGDARLCLRGFVRHEFEGLIRLPITVPRIFTRVQEFFRAFLGVFGAFRRHHVHERHLIFQVVCFSPCHFVPILSKQICVISFGRVYTRAVTFLATNHSCFFAFSVKSDFRYS